MTTRNSLRFLIDDLSLAGHHCSGCDNGADALLRLRQEQFELVVLDWSLPDFSGVEVCRRLRSSGNTTPVLMLTARDDIDERVQALDAGVDDYLTKPFNRKELHARVRARLRRGSYQNSRRFRCGAPAAGGPVDRAARAAGEAWRPGDRLVCPGI